MQSALTIEDLRKHDPATRNAEQKYEQLDG